MVDFNQIKKAIYTVANPPAHLFEEIDFMLHVNDDLDTWEQQWQMPMRMAAGQEGVRTIFSGFPGDEMVTYRGKYYYLDYLDKKQYLKYLLAKRKLPGFHKLFPLVPHAARYRLHLAKHALRLYNNDIKAALKIFNIPAEAIKNKGDISWLAPW